MRRATQLTAIYAFTGFLICSIHAEEDTVTSAAPTLTRQVKASIRLLPSDAQSAKTLVPRFQSLMDNPAEIEIGCDVLSTEAIDGLSLSLTVSDPHGNEQFAGRTPILIQKGTTPVQFLWVLGDTREGRYSARMELKRRSGAVVATQDLEIKILSDASVTRKLAEVATALESLRSQIETNSEQSGPVGLARIRMAIANDYVKDANTAFQRGDWVKADSFADYLLTLARTTATQSAHAARELSADHRLEVKGGAIFDSGSPAFLFGAAADEDLISEFPALARYGLNFGVVRVGPTETLSTLLDHGDSADRLERVLSAARKQGIRVVVQLAPERLPAWAYDQWPALADSTGGSFMYDVTRPEARALLKRHVRAVGSVVRDHSSVMAVSLAENPAFRLPDDVLREGLITLARTTYRDRDHVNRVWRTHLMTLDEIAVDWNSRHKAYQFDLQSYHQELGAEFFAWLSSMMGEAAPDVPQLVQTSGTAFEPSESSMGVNREWLAPRFPISGCSVVQDFEHEYLAMGYPRQGLHYNLLRSFNPDAPVFNTADGFTCDPDVTGELAFSRVRAMMWEAAIEGLNASAMALGKAGDRAHVGILSRPEYVDGYVTASHELNALGPIVNAFQHAPAPVQILWSMSSKILSSGLPYLESVQRAYEGCSTFGYRVRFVSEHEIARTGLTGVTVLVIPQALALESDAFRAIDAFIDGGGITIRKGGSIPYDQRAVSRTDIFSTSARTVLMRAEDAPNNYLHALDAAYDLGALEAIPRAINRAGYPLEAVKTRFVLHEGQPYLYIINLRKTPVEVSLFGGYTKGRDIISGADIDFPRSLRPLELMVLALEGMPADSKKAEESPATVAYRVELAPVASEAPKTKAATPRNSKRHGR